MIITHLDIWLSKIKYYGWKIEDIPERYKELREELKKRLGV